jgi:hypothetical protein
MNSGAKYAVDELLRDPFLTFCCAQPEHGFVNQPRTLLSGPPTESQRFTRVHIDIVCVFRDLCDGSLDKGVRSAGISIQSDGVDSIGAVDYRVVLS